MTNLTNAAPVVPLLTPQRQRVLSAIRDHYALHGYAPSVRDVAEAVGVAVSTAQFQIEQLHRMGWIRRHPGRSRALVVLDPATGGP